MTGAATPTDAGLPAGGRGEPPSLAEVATAFPELEILGLIGAGGMGFVYRVRQLRDGQEAALKLLPRSLAADPAFVERFNREARTLARLHHPNIVGVLGFGQSGGFCHLTMEYVDGANLRQAMRAGRFTAAQALEIVPRLCDALQYAHSQGVLHRDIKPENILLDARGRVKIADFGIAKLLDDTGGTAAEITLTQTGHRLGTPHYMAPEQIEKPADVDHRADIYSLGVVFYELLTGELPLGRFAAPSAKAYVDTRIDDIVFRALAKERELRQQSAGEVRSDVEGLQKPPANPEPRPRLRSDNAHISTPEHQATLWGKAIYIYTGSGFLELTADVLRFTGTGSGSPVEIPLKAVVALGQGEYSRIAKPTGLLHIIVRHEKDGRIQTHLFTPYHSNWDSTAKTNALVVDWCGSIREAASRALGHPPAAIPESGVQGRPFRPTLFHSLALVIGLAIAAALSVPVAMACGFLGVPAPMATFIAMAVSVALTLGLSWRWVVASGRGPDTSASLAKRLGILAGIGVLLVGLIVLGRRLQDEAKQSRESADTNSPISRLAFELPERSTRVFVTRFWSNGVPHELPGLQTSFTAGTGSSRKMEATWSISQMKDSDVTVLSVSSTANPGAALKSTPIQLPKEVGLCGIFPGYLQLGLGWNEGDPDARVWLFAEPAEKRGNAGEWALPGPHQRTNMTWGIDVVLRKAGGGTAPGVVGPVRLLRTSRERSTNEVRLTWDLRSPTPLDFAVTYLNRAGGPVRLAPGPDGKEAVGHLQAVFSRRSDGTGVDLAVSTAENGPILSTLVAGDADGLLKTAAELLSGDLAGLEPGKPVWIAFGGLEQVRLEVLKPRVDVQVPTGSVPRP